VLWLVLLINSMLFGGALNRYGIVPRTPEGLRGIVFAPFLHAGVAHLSANSTGLLLFGGLVLMRRRTDFWVVTFAGMLIGGLCTWLLARPSVHIGASGIVFAYLGYLLCTGIFERRIAAIALSLVVGFAWGGVLFGVLPGQRGISWESHLFGAISGAFAAWLLAVRRRR
jgi:membrane associated rhomboid family serine protease